MFTNVYVGTATLRLRGDVEGFVRCVGETDTADPLLKDGESEEAEAREGVDKEGGSDGAKTG